MSAAARICWACGLETPYVESHHVVPQAQGGPDDAWNRRDLCTACHDFVTYVFNGKWEQLLTSPTEALFGPGGDRRWNLLFLLVVGLWAAIRAGEERTP